MLENILALVKGANEIIWGFPTIILLLGCGIYFSFRLKFFQFTKIGLWLKNTLLAVFKSDEVRKGKKGKNLSQFQAVSTALASTIGTGNIAGVATAISAGGPGAVFWMWISAFFGMMTSYAENVLGIYFRQKNENEQWSGGPMFYIKNGLSRFKIMKHIALPLSIIYACLLIGASFGIGNMTQANSISDALSSTFGVPVYVSAAVLAVLTFFVISGGVKRIGSVTEKIVPFMALFYISATLYLFISNYKQIPFVFSSIFQSAFSLRSILGAGGGLIVKKAVSVGFRRGIFSNEAGLGASVTVNSASDIKEPVKQGMWGIFQVFVDTIIVCTMTAFVLLSTSVDAVPVSDAIKNISPETQYVYAGEKITNQNGEVMIAGTEPSYYKTSEKSSENGFNLTDSDDYSFTGIMALKGVYDETGELADISLNPVDGVSLVTLAFRSRFGNLAAVILAAATILFAFSTVIGWSFYGCKAAEFISGKKGVKIYKFIFVLVSFVGAVIKLSVVWEISDIFNGLMVIPNLIALFALSGTVIKITDNFLKRRSGKNISPLLSAYENIQTEMEFDIK